LGVKFTSDVSGYISGIRFYKGSTNTGTHTGSLWTTAGTLLATATFSGETISGWQQVNFTSPVAIAANTTYVASYHTSVGFYAGDSQFFASSSVNRPPLHALANGTSGGNGVYVYGSGGRFPTSTYQSSNYWVDVVFDTPQGAPTYSISGTIAGGAASTVTLSGAASLSTTADGSGNFSFSGLANGSYAVTPSNAGYTFNPTSRAVTINGVNVSGVNFTATAAAPTYSISGTISQAATGAGSLVTLSGAASFSTTADSSGKYSFTALSNGAYTVAPSSQMATFSPTSQAVTINNSNVSGVNFTATATANVIFFDDFTGTTLGPAWTVISRHGEYGQDETECNTPQQVSVANSNLIITTALGPATCGDFNIDGSVRHSPSSWNYISGDIQWTSKNFTYGTVEYRAKFPPQSTGTWPAVWMLTAGCQTTNIFTADTNYDSCPGYGQPGYVEIDATECDLNNWCQLLYYNGPHTPFCGYRVDANWHVFTLTWSPDVISMTVDGQPTCRFDGGANSNNIPIPSTPMFLLIQTQTGGVGGTPNNALLPAQLLVDYVKVTQP
jgi:hypothetical protein